MSPDGRSVVFSMLQDGQERLFLVDAAGGTPVRVTDYPSHTPAFSPDGRRLAFYYLDRSSQRFRIGIAPVTGGPPETSLDAEIPSNQSRIVFTDEGLWLNTVVGDRANVWLQPIDGRPPRRLTDFQDSPLFAFVLSRDGKSLAHSRGPRTRDALLIKGFR